LHIVDSELIPVNFATNCMHIIALNLQEVRHRWI
jgi:hypothetical protein